MKKLLSTILAVSLIISATACNGQHDDRTDFTTRATETAYDPSIKEPDQTINTMSPDQTTETPADTTETSVAPNQTAVFRNVPAMQLQSQSF